MDNEAARCTITLRTTVDCAVDTFLASILHTPLNIARISTMWPNSKFDHNLVMI